MIKVLFVCLGNICRSPLAEAVFNSKVNSLTLEADSAGTAAYHIGKQPDHRSIKVAQDNNIPINHRARQFVVEDFDRFDYVIAMDENNRKDMEGLSRTEVKNLYLLREFDLESEGELDVPDPYYGGYDGFVEIYEMIDRSIDELLKHINNESKK
ncbi:MAG: low molecular weight phosphotyrosine protein phosphatase [Reichenbachiella sp.]